LATTAYSIEHIISPDGRKSAAGNDRLSPAPGPDGREHYYSSKPPLLSTLLAGQYWLVKQATSLSLSEPRDVWTVVRTMLVLTNVVPLVIALGLLARMIDEFGQSDWGRLFTFAAAACHFDDLQRHANNHSCGVHARSHRRRHSHLRGRGRWWHTALAGLLLADCRH
jgi:hypothetical protein